MYDPKSEETFGPHVDFREYSFLSNKKAAPLNASSVTVVVCKVRRRLASNDCLF
jgi:hypothetical protein